MTLEQILWALLKTDILVIVVVTIFAVAEWTMDGDTITDAVKATTKYKIANGISRVAFILLPLLIIGVIWV